MVVGEQALLDGRQRAVASVCHFALPPPASHLLATSVDDPYDLCRYFSPSVLYRIHVFATKSIHADRIRQYKSTTPI